MKQTPRRAWMLVAISSAMAAFALGGAFSLPAAYEKASEEPDDLTIKHAALDTLGDCALAQIGDCDILIDCGSMNAESNEAIYQFLSENLHDSTLDYVVVTHQDKDHVNGFINLDSGLPSGIFRWLHEGMDRHIGTLIDFDSTMDSTVTPKRFAGIKDQNFYTSGKKYQSARNTLLQEGKIEMYLTASQCSYKKRIKDGNLTEDEVDVLREDIAKNNTRAGKTISPKSVKLSDTFPLADGGTKVSLKILYNVFNSSHEVSEDASDPLAKSSLLYNQMSVCSMITYGNDRFLFTGDLEEFDSSSPGDPRVFGETRLVKNNYDDLKDGVLFYRGGHHGSRTSSSTYFTSIIKPQYVCWSGVAGMSPANSFESNDKKALTRFPTQNAIDSVGRYTDRIYYSKCLGRYIDGKAEGEIIPLYGSTTFTYSPKKERGKRMSVAYETEEPQSFFLSSYMNRYIKDKAERSIPAYVYNLTASSVPSDKPIDCSYVKIGHIDILIGAGQKYNDNVPDTYKKEVVGKILDLCNDRVLDYLIVPSNSSESLSFLTGENGLLKKDIDIQKIYAPKGALGESFPKELMDKGITPISKETLVPISLTDEEADEDSPVSIRFLKGDYGSSETENMSLLTVISAFGARYLHLGSNATYDSKIIDDNESWIKGKIDAIQLPRFGSITGDSSENFYQFMTDIASSEDNHAYSGYGRDKVSEKELSGMVGLLNTTFATNEGKLSCPSEHLFKVPSEAAHARFYDNKGRHMLLFPTMFTNPQEKEAKAKPFNSGVNNGDICLKLSCIPSIKRLRMAVAPNYASDEDKALLLFNGQGKKSGDEMSSASGASMIDGEAKIKEIKEAFPSLF